MCLLLFRQQCWLIVVHYCGGLSILPPVGHNWLACLQTLQLQPTQRLRILVLSSCLLKVGQQPKHYSSFRKLASQAISLSNTTVYNSLIQSFQTQTRCKNSELRSSLSCMTRMLIRAWVRIRDHYQGWSLILVHSLWPGTISGPSLQYRAETLIMLFQLHFPA